MLEADIINETVKEKYGMMKSKTIDLDECVNGQIKSEKGPFDKIDFGLKGTNFNGPISREDYVMGFKIYSIIVFCNPETLKLGQFLYNLASEENLSTIVKATVNTIELERIEEMNNRKQLFGFYAHLEKALDLQLGRIIIALSSPKELNEMLSRKLPFTAPYSREIEACFNNKECSELSNVVNSQGKLVLGKGGKWNKDEK